MGGPVLSDNACSSSGAEGSAGSEASVSALRAISEDVAQAGTGWPDSDPDADPQDAAVVI